MQQCKMSSTAIYIKLNSLVRELRRWKLNACMEQTTGTQACMQSWMRQLMQATLRGLSCFITKMAMVWPCIAAWRNCNNLTAVAVRHRCTERRDWTLKTCLFTCLLLPSCLVRMDIAKVRSCATALSILQIAFLCCRNSVSLRKYLKLKRTRIRNPAYEPLLRRIVRARMTFTMKNRLNQSPFIS